jgi:tetratricopeptide (TPR) repeat protein
MAVSTRSAGRGGSAMQEEDRQEHTASALLFQLRGESPSSTYPLPRGVFRIGSDEENDLVLRDRDVKPNQLEIRFVEGAFLLKNLATQGSVFLNGEPFEEATLQKGDILTVGESMFRYVDLGETLSQEDLWRPVGGKQGVPDTRKRPLRRFAFLGIFALLALGSVMLLLFTQGKEVEQAQPGAQDKLSDLEKTVDREELKVQYERGKDLLAARRWDEAILVLESIRKQMPNFMDVEDLYQEALGESEYVDILNRGKGLVLENELVDAKAQMDQIPKKSVYYREAERLSREIEEMALEERIREALAALTRGDWSFAQQEAESVLATYPNNKEARRILLEARMLQRQHGDKGSGVLTAWSPRRPDPSPTPEGAKPSEAVQPETEPPASPPETVGRPASSPGRMTSGGSIPSAIAAYRQGRTDDSLSYLEKALNGAQGKQGAGATKAQELKEDIQSALTYFQQAKNLQQAGRYLEALEVWERFLERDQRIAGEQGGVYFLEASDLLGKIYFERGKTEFDRGNPIGAAIFWKMGAEVNPKDQELRMGMGQLDEVARKLYREGYSLQEINVLEAIEKWKEVMMIVSPDNPYYKKAKNRVDRYAESP